MDRKDLIHKMVLVTKPDDERIMDAIADGEIHILREVADALGLHRATCDKLTKKLADRGCIVVGRVRSDKRGQWLAAIQRKA